jgi:hypothetical protein
MPRYRWRGDGAFQDNRNGREIAPGETVELPERVAAPHASMVPVPVDEDEPGEGADTDAPIDPGEFTVGELRDHVHDAEYSDAELAAIANAERAGKDRATALDTLTTEG